MWAIAVLLLQAASPLPTAAPSPPPAKQKQICRATTATGSRIGGRKICATAEEWEQRQREDRATIEGLQANTVPNVG